MPVMDLVTVDCSATELQGLSTASSLKAMRPGSQCTAKSGLDLKIKHL